MKKVFILKGLDCPNCAAKIEKEVGSAEGVYASTVNLIKQTLTLEINENATKSIDKTVEKIVHSHEPEVEVYPQSAKPKAEEKGGRAIIVRLITGGVIFAAGLLAGWFNWCVFPVELGLLICSYVILGYDVLLKAAKNIIKGRIFDENFLMSISTLGAFFIKEYPEAVAVMLFYQVGEYFQGLSVRKSRKSISDLMDIRPDISNLLRGEEIVTVSPESLKIGDIIVVKPGEKIPVDGIIVSGESMLDTAALTGEHVPKTARVGDRVLSGCIAQNGLLKIEVEKEYGESTVAKIINLVENAVARKAPTENFITVFAKYYTPVVVGLAAVLAVVPSLIFGGWAEWIHRALVFLVISCPCALVISIPLAFFGGIGAASKKGILVKGGNYLEALTKAGTVVFDKTGTLTKGVFNVSTVVAAKGFTAEKILEYAAMAEIFSNHPIAKSIIKAYGKDADQNSVDNYNEISGHGVSVVYENKRILAGNTKLLDKEGINYTVCPNAGTKVYVAVDKEYAGCIVIADEIKPDSGNAIAELKNYGIENAIMLTGDDEKAAQEVAETVGIKEYYAGLLPHQKVEKLEEICNRKNGGRLIFVGDGINDAPVLARADVGVAMGGLGSDAAIEAADVVLMTDEPKKIAEAIGIAKATKRIVVQNIIIALGVKGIFLVLGIFGIAGMWEAVFSDVGVALIAIFNSMRVLKK